MSKTIAIILAAVGLAVELAKRLIDDGDDDESDDEEEDDG